ncbi:MAG: hypothetical protein CO108_24330 [Deltaproteobacteria bacterium CG_4_9_14_3_um_filter_63_12]|nr:MAG: hypothetical protein CO108_24330 [Deltaproteobacteria bacterium CG_4_9_14_3_um_filter_63_12]
MDTDFFLKKLQHIVEPQMRVVLVRTAVMESAPADVFELVGAFVERALIGIAPGEDAVLAFVRCMQTLERTEATYEQFREIYLYAHSSSSEEPANESLHRLRNTVVGHLFLDPPPFRKLTTKQAQFAPKWDREVSLGQKKTFASGGNRLYLEKLVYEGDPQVIAKLCANPRLNEQDILTIVTRRPNEVAVLHEVAISAWISSYTVRHGLVLNPYNGTGMILRLMPLLHHSHLAALRFAGDVHPLVQETANALFELRGALMAPKRAAEGAVSEENCPSVVEEKPPSVEASSSDVEASSPDVEASSSDVEASSPDVEASSPDVEASPLESEDTSIPGEDETVAEPLEGEGKEGTEED